MNKSGIEWTDATWNPVSGCSKVSQGCKNCYAERMFARPYPGRDFTDVRTHMDRLEQPLRMRKGRRIFVNSMSDLFHEDVPEEFVDQIFAVMALCPQHTFQILTKRPISMSRSLLDRLANPDEAPARIADALGKMLDGEWIWKEGKQFRQRIEKAISACYGVDHDENSSEIQVPTLDWPLPNVWLGVSVEDQATADERIPLLLQTPAAVRFISAEPLLGPISFEGMFATDTPNDGTNALEKLNLVIAGGESGPGARPSHPDWFRSLRDQCAAAGTAFFFKQWGEWCPDDQHRLATGTDGPVRAYVWDQQHSVISERIGKSAAGRTLDGREHNDLPGTPCTTA